MNFAHSEDSLFPPIHLTVRSLLASVPAFIFYVSFVITGISLTRLCLPPTWADWLRTHWEMNSGTCPAFLDSPYTLLLSALTTLMSYYAVRWVMRRFPNLFLYPIRQVSGN